MMKTSNGKTKNGAANGVRKFTTQASLDSYVKGICDILRRSNCARVHFLPQFGVAKERISGRGGASIHPYLVTLTLITY
jgi:hypothetical protein